MHDSLLLLPFPLLFPRFHPPNSILPNNWFLVSILLSIQKHLFTADWRGTRSREWWGIIVNLRLDV